MRISTFRLIAALSLGVVTFGGDALGQSLAPNAEALLARQAMGQQRMRVAGREMAADESQQLTAYIYIDEPQARQRLEELGVSVRGDYGTYLTASLPASLLQQAGAVEGVAYITLGNDVSLLNDYARNQLGVNKVHANPGTDLPRVFTGKGVVVGVIDTGVEYGHLNFRAADGSSLRFKRVWEQLSRGGTPPAKFGYGVEYTDGNALMAKAYDSSMEYHGCHTIGTAAGSDTSSPYYGVAPEADLVFVSFQNDDASIADAIQYIFDYADEVDKPCVINMSLGEHTGPHNGTSALDRHIDALTGPGRIIVGACGNEGQYRLHASKVLTADDNQLKTMLTFAEGVTHKYHYLDIWGSEGTDFSVQFCTVNALKGNIVWSSQAFDTSNPDQQTVVRAIYVEDEGLTGTLIMSGEVNPLNGQPHVRIESSIEDMAEGRIPGVVITGQDGQRIDLWNFSGHEFSANGKRGWTDGTNVGTVGEIGGTALTIIPVGSYDSRPTIPWTSGGYSYWSEAMAYDADSRSAFSSVGPTADGRVAPAVLAPGSPVISSINQYAYRSMGVDLYTYTNGRSYDSQGRAYYYGHNVGTSMSAPFVTGTVALMLEARPDLTPAQARQIIEQTAVTDSRMGTLPNCYYGSGRLNSLECVKGALALTGIESTAADADGFGARVWTEGSTVFVAIDSASAGASAEVYTVSGTLVTTVPLTEGLTSIPADGMAKGVYIVRVVNGNSVSSVKTAL